MDDDARMIAQAGSGGGTQDSAARFFDGRLEAMGFHTLTDRRCAKASADSALGRCVLVLTDRCNFACPYCRKFGGGDLPFDDAARCIEWWAEEGLKALVLTGGEPTLHAGLPRLVSLAARLGLPRICVATNGSADPGLYLDLIDRGVDEFSISLDSSEAGLGDLMAGGIPGAWRGVVATIALLSPRTRVTVGAVLDPENLASAREIVALADSLGVADIRLNPAAQFSRRLPVQDWDRGFLERHPTFAWRAAVTAAGGAVRGLEADDPHRCHIVLDEMTAREGEHYPCFVYMREGGRPIGRMGLSVRKDRERWSTSHDPFEDRICRSNCPDICRTYNRRFELLRASESVGETVCG